MDLLGMLRDVIRIMEPQGRHMGVEIMLENPPTTPVTIEADRQRLQQVFTNLILNAIQAMPTGGKVVIVLEDGPHSVWVSVTDEGGGFSPEALGKVGEPFYSEKEGGLGLGLAVAVDICKAHGGSLSASNSSQGGARIRIELAKGPIHNGETS